MIVLNEAVSEKYKVVFPFYPRTVNRLEEFELSDFLKSNSRLTLNEPRDYFSFQKLIRKCKVVLTARGSIKEEPFFRQVSCLRLCPNMQRPPTIELENNTIMPFYVKKMIKKFVKLKEEI